MGEVRRSGRSSGKAISHTGGDQSAPVPMAHSAWSRMGDNGHLALFYETDSYLLDSLTEFITVSLMAGEAAITVATPEHSAALEQRLQQRGVDMAGAKACGQFVTLDAAVTLAAFMVDGSPDAARFNTLLGGIIAQAARWKRIRIFGEMVSLLCAQGNYQATLHLEQLWNDLNERHPFLLLCSYPLNEQSTEALAMPLSKICSEHSLVIPAESYNVSTSEDERLHSIILLQQKARLLQAEIAERDRAEERLRISDLRYRRLFEASANGILIIDPLTYRIYDANPAIADLLSIPREDLLGTPLWKVGLFGSQQEVMTALDGHRDKQVLHHKELYILLNDGRHRSLECVSTIYQANGHQVIQCSIRDITERRQAEAALLVAKDELQQQLDDLRRLHEMSIRLTGLHDLDTLLQEVLRAALTVQSTDLGLLSLHDKERGGIVVRAHSGFADEVLNLIAWVPSGRGVYGTCFEQRQRVIVEDVESDPIFAGYRDVARLTGFQSIHSTPLITSSGQIIGVLSAHFREKRRPSERETRLMDLYARMVTDYIESVRSYERMQHELEERKWLLRREHEARAEAERASRMKDEFLATVSHELRTPLTIIISWAQRLLRRDRRDLETITRGLEIIEHNALAQAQLVDDILDVSQLITGKLRLNVDKANLVQVINAAIDSVQLAADSKDIQLALTLDPSARHIVGDSNRLQQVFWNILTNAIRFTPSGGRVDVRLERAGADVWVQVSDTGEGIDPDVLPFIFDRFRQADGSSKRKHRGLGLGLAIVRHLVELHGGTVRAESAGVGQGATFIVQLPLARVQD